MYVVLFDILLSCCLMLFVIRNEEKSFGTLHSVSLYLSPSPLGLSLDRERQEYNILLLLRFLQDDLIIYIIRYLSLKSQVESKGQPRELKSLPSVEAKEKTLEYENH